MVATGRMAQSYFALRDEKQAGVSMIGFGSPNWRR
jgi:hypothetical protein